jgi:hypothetical protein
LLSSNALFLHFLFSSSFCFLVVCNCLLRTYKKKRALMNQIFFPSSLTTF